MKRRWKNFTWLFKHVTRKGKRELWEELAESRAGAERLKKALKISNNEFRAMRRSSQEGVRMIKNVDSIIQHHGMACTCLTPRSGQVLNHEIDCDSAAAVSV